MMLMSTQERKLNPSREYLKSLRTTGREVLAKQIKEMSPGIKVTGTHLYLIGVGKRSPSRKLTVLLEEATRGKVASIDFNREMQDEIA